MHLRVRKFQVIYEDTLYVPGCDSEPILRKVAAAAIVENPYASKTVQDLQPLVDASPELGATLTECALEAMGSLDAQSYGKAGMVGIRGEQEHASALLTTAFATPLRERLGGARAWMSSVTKIGVPGTPIDVPLSSKDALYVRSHYDAMSITFPDAPLPDEIIVIICLANRGRLNARVGGLKYEEIATQDGLT